MQFTSDIDETGQGTRSSQFAADPLMQSAQTAQQTFPQSALYIVGLPIGNAADITLRALWVLDICDRVACEDTRETRKLLDRYGISTPTISVHEHNERSASQKIIDYLAKGERIALVTDAGTPAVSDPGAKAVQSVREAGFRVVPVPGASAVVTALSASGLDSYSFTFAGFVPPSGKARRTALSKLAQKEEAFVLYEAPHRICDLLKDLADVLHAGRRVVVARELTKKFETFDAMTASDLPDWAQAHDPRGEYAVVVDMQDKSEEGPDAKDLKWLRAIAEEMPKSRAAALAAKVTGMKRDAIYQMLNAENSE